MLSDIFGCYNLVLYSSISPGYLPSFKVLNSVGKNMTTLCVCVSVCVKSILIFLTFISANSNARHNYSYIHNSSGKVYFPYLH